MSTRNNGTLTAQFNTLSRTLFLSLIILSTFFSSCDQPSETTDLRQKNDSLKASLFKNDSIVQNLVKTLLKIDSNTRAIRTKKLTVQQQISKKSLKESEKDSVLLYMSQIDQLTEINRNLADQMAKNLADSNQKINGVDQLVYNIQEKNELKLGEVNELKGKLTTINKDFRELFEEYVYTEAIKMELNERNLSLEENNSLLIKQLNTAWYAIGTKSELKEKGLIAQKGVLNEMFDVKNLNQNLDKNLFTQIDIRDFNELKINAKKAKLISPHPPKSYSFIKQKKTVEKLVIDDLNQFWDVSKYLLIEIEN